MLQGGRGAPAEKILNPVNSSLALYPSLPLQAFFF